MSEKLEPCPFGCDGPPIECENHTGAVMHWVMCSTCHASPGDRPTPAEARAAWNRRAARAEARPAPVVDREAVAGPAYTSVGYQYRFSDPMSGHPVWRTSSAQWNGQRPQETREIFALLSPATSPGEGSSGAAVGVLHDKIEGLEEELFSAVKVAYQRGAVEWTRLNYPAWFERFKVGGGQPTPTPDDGGGGG